MTKHEIKAVLDRVLTWPEARQEEAAELLLALEAEEAVYVPTDDEVAAIHRGLAEAEAGKFATDEEVDSVLGRPWKK